MKKKLLGVSRGTIERYTPVSPEVAREMAVGVRKLASSDIGVSTTGYAGPLGGSENDPVGTVYVGLSTAGKTTARRFFFTGERKKVVQDASREALRTILEELQEGQ